jgi:hypothetical protein
MSQIYNPVPSSSREYPSAESSPRIWAILVGVNYYSGKAKDLFGCVRDIQAQREYLKNRTHYIAELTIDAPPESNSVKPSPDSKYPTLQNVTMSLETVADGAREGDHVYIHFSGHGTQVIDESTPSEKGFGDLAWVLYDETTGISYFYERQLASAASDMANKGCFVTVVLDCCFSGSVGRHDRESFIRTTRYNHEIGLKYPPTSILNPSERRISVKRGATKSAQPGSFFDPGTYAILTACGPDERSEEIVFPNKTRSGALSHFLLRALKSHNGENLSIRLLYNHLRLKFEQLHPQQSPMCYGRRDVSFLGCLLSPTTENYATVSKHPKNNVLHMDRGVAHGVSMGDEYALYPMGWEAGTKTGSPPASFNAYVSEVNASMSELIKMEDPTKLDRSESRWEAKPLSLSCRKLDVKISFADENVSSFIERLRVKHFVHAVIGLTDEVSAAFSVTLNEHGGYSITERAGSFLEDLPVIPQTNIAAAQEVADIVGRCAQFSYVRFMENLTPDPDFEQAFTCHIEDPEGVTLQAGEMITVKEQQKLKLVIQNFSDKPLFATVLVLEPTRKIGFLESKSKTGRIAETDAETVTAPRPKNEYGPAHTGILKRSFKMDLPSHLHARGRKPYQNIFKVILTSRSTSFACLCMPPVAATTRSSSSGSRHFTYHDILRCVFEIESSSRGPNTAKDHGCWTTRTFNVCVSSD